MRIIRFVSRLAAAALLAGCPFQNGQDEASPERLDGGGNLALDAGAGGSREIPWDWDSDSGLPGGGTGGSHTGGSGGAAGSGGTSGSGGSGTLPPATPPLSNVPNATWVNTGAAGLGSGLRIKSA